MSTTAGDLEVGEFCQQAHAKKLAQRFVNLTVEVPFWTACSANEWVDKFNGEGRGFVCVCVRSRACVRLCTRLHVC